MDWHPAKGMVFTNALQHLDGFFLPSGVAGFQTALLKALKSVSFLDEQGNGCGRNELKPLTGIIWVGVS